jgi:hypothetical protein
MTVKEQVALYIKEDVKRDKNGLLYVTPDFDYIYRGVLDNFDIIYEKLNALVNKLNSLSGAELEEFLEKDFETEVYDNL